MALYVRIGQRDASNINHPGSNVAIKAWPHIHVETSWQHGVTTNGQSHLYKNNIYFKRSSTFILP